ncbi:MAG: DUF192 domain-containing protein [Patescibacteria group bacterium]
MKESLFFIVVVVLIVTANFIWVDKKYVSLSPKEKIEESKIQYVEIAGKRIKVEVVATPEARALGLSGRERLKEDEGLLFIFPNSAAHLFWMKDMKFSIDIIWLDEDGRVVYIKKNARPESYPEVFKPEQNAKYVLEVLAGFSDKNNLKDGNGIEFIP